MAGVNEWDNEYARLARAASQLRTQGLVSGGDQQRSLQQGLQRLEAQLHTLPLPPAEMERRRRLVQHLQQSGSQPGTPAGSTIGGSGIGSPPQSQMAMAMRQQDGLIDELAAGVSRLKNQTHLIGEEANMHVNLMNDMENNLEAAQAGLESETRRAAQLKQDQSVWRLQLIVAGECVLFVLLILMGIS
ncbi:AlNc14C14G1635 [Seminavis robusta]|uniref:AlNc14C14G1635 n=1 Tax=Seminavis robusta TaxID=568900 RepID=A0A9N8ED93_9STRA|nr:AlNc14C14G1635 [Seminavis robusta]|eukprot:Sro980_g227440.1 AlNc14C14G1635 (188) ;mRNA; f:29046-29609